MVNVFNRYGTPIFKSIGYSKAWNGEYNNQPVSAGTYYYTIDLKDGSKIISGWIAVIR
jgi:gliding motility-associated-like protein